MRSSWKFFGLLFVAADALQRGSTTVNEGGSYRRLQNNMGMMETPAPTNRPTPEPTPLPTVSPTVSVQPSERPSSTPSVSPSTIPTLTPSVKPSQLPSFAPSNTPSSVPSAGPTAIDRIPCGVLTESPMPRGDNFKKFIYELSATSGSLTVPAYIFNAAGTIRFFYEGVEVAATPEFGNLLYSEQVTYAGSSIEMEVTVETTGDGSQAYWIMRVPCS